MGTRIMRRMVMVGCDGGEQVLGLGWTRLVWGADGLYRVEALETSGRIEW